MVTDLRISAADAPADAQYIFAFGAGRNENSAHRFERLYSNSSMKCSPMCGDGDALPPAATTAPGRTLAAAVSHARLARSRHSAASLAREQRPSHRRVVPAHTTVGETVAPSMREDTRSDDRSRAPVGLEHILEGGDARERRAGLAAQVVPRVDSHVALALGGGDDGVVPSLWQEERLPLL